MATALAENRIHGCLDSLERNIRFGRSCAERELDEMLAVAVAESNRSLSAAAVLFGLNLETLKERAANMEFDGGLARTTANRMALTLELRQLTPGLSDAAGRWFAQNIAAVLLYALERGLGREQLVAELCAYLERHFGEDAAVPLPGRAG